LTVYFLVSVGYLLVLRCMVIRMGDDCARGFNMRLRMVATAVLGQIFHSAGAWLMPGDSDFDLCCAMG